MENNNILFFSILIPEWGNFTLTKEVRSNHTIKDVKDILVTTNEFTKEEIDNCYIIHKGGGLKDDVMVKDIDTSKHKVYLISKPE